MSMTSSMCVSMTGKPTRLQIANEERRQRYRTVGILSKQRKCNNCPYWKDTATESGCSAPYSCKEIN